MSFEIRKRGEYKSRGVCKENEEDL